MMTKLPYTTETDDRPKLGLIVLQADETIEDDFRRVFDPDAVRLHISRIPSGAELTEASIQEMEADLPAAAALFPKGVTFDAVGYACTSGTSLIGEDRVAELVQSACETRSVTNPLSAAFRSFRALRADRIGIVSPYSESIAAQMRRGFEANGFTVPLTDSFGEEVEANVARIATSGIVDAVRKLLGQADLDAVFLSCTNLRTFRAIGALKRETEVPVLSSNLCLALDLAERAGVSLRQP